MSKAEQTLTTDEMVAKIDDMKKFGKIRLYHLWSEDKALKEKERPIADRYNTRYSQLEHITWVGDIAIAETTDSDGNTIFDSYVDGKCTQMSRYTFDEALLGALLFKHNGFAPQLLDGAIRLMNMPLVTEPLKTVD